MPISRISMRTGKSAAYRSAILDGVFRALHDALGVPDGDEFMVINEHDEVNFRYGNYLGIERSANLIYIQVTVFTRERWRRRRHCTSAWRGIWGRAQASARRTSL